MCGNKTVFQVMFSFPVPLSHSAAHLLAQCQIKLCTSYRFLILNTPTRRANIHGEQRLYIVYNEIEGGVHSLDQMHQIQTRSQFTKYSRPNQQVHVYQSLVIFFFIHITYKIYWQSLCSNK